MTATSYTITSGAGSVASDAQFRSYGSGLASALAAVGMVQTADTGQINWTTVARPGTANTQAGYEVWRFNDTLQATAPLFVRIGYGTGSSAGVFSLWFTIGKGSDGAGAITGTITAQTQVAYANTTGAATYTNYLSSGDGSALVIMLTPSGSGPSYLFVVIERSRTPAGAATGTGYVFAWKVTAANAPTVTATNYTLASTLTQVGWPAAAPVQATAMASGGKAPVFPAVVYDGAGNFWQPRAIVSGHTTDLGSLVAITVPGLGTYLPAACQPWAATTAYANIAAAFVWA